MTALEPIKIARAFAHLRPLTSLGDGITDELAEGWANYIDPCPESLLAAAPVPQPLPKPGEFLERLRPRPWVLTAIVPDGPSTTTTARTAAEVDAFVSKHNGNRNLYYSINPTRTAISKKAAKTDIATIEYIHFDGDPRDDETPEAAKARYLKAIEESGIKFTFGIDSGNGIQGLIRLTERIELGPLIRPH